MKKPTIVAATTPEGADFAAELGVDVVALPPRAIDPATPVDVRARVAIFDAVTGERIEKVTFADVEAKKLTRFAVVDGNLVRNDKGRYDMIEEDREIRIEWIEEPAA